jgi:acetaldehyde dehydrogenase (acetylating)
VVADEPIAPQLRAEMQQLGAYWVSGADKQALERALFTPAGGMDPQAVGKTPQQLARIAGIDVPPHARILVADLEQVGRDEPLSGEKLTTVLGFYVENGWRAGCERCIELLRFGGDGHSQVIHARDEEVILAFGIEKPAFRIVVNTWGTLGAIGATTGVMPAMTLAPGGIGGAVTSDNITVTNLLNVKRVAYPLRDPPAAAYEHAVDVRGAPAAAGRAAVGTAASSGDERVERIVRRVLEELGRAR